MLGARALAAVQGSLTPGTFGASLMGTSAMIAPILAGAAGLSQAIMAVTGRLRGLAELIGDLEPTRVQRPMALLVFCTVVEMAQITPPIGVNPVVLHGMTQHGMGSIARAALPIFLTMVGMVVLSTCAPGLRRGCPKPCVPPLARGGRAG